MPSPRTSKQFVRPPATYTDPRPRQADLLDISGATDIHGTKFDDPSHPIATKGKLDKNITPGEYVSFVDFLDDTQLARFGVHNGMSLSPWT